MHITPSNPITRVSSITSASTDRVARRARSAAHAHAMSGDGDDDARALSREDLVYKAKLAEQAERCVRSRRRGLRDRA